MRTVIGSRDVLRLLSPKFTCKAVQVRGGWELHMVYHNSFMTKKCEDEYTIHLST